MGQEVFTASGRRGRGLLTLDRVDHFTLQLGGQHGTGQIQQEPDHPVTKGRHLQLLQV